MRKSTSGFTIVELLIVIVVIGILAAIVIVAYNGVQTQAKNTKTISAAEKWIKALRLYQAETGSLPNLNSCFGTTTTYSGNGWCWDSATWVVQPSFLTAMAPYIGNAPPEPDTSQIDTVTNTNRRGAFYYGTAAIDYVYVMLTGTSTCPTISGLSGSRGIGPDGIYCVYTLS